MKKIFLYSIMLFAAMAFNACSDKDLGETAGSDRLARPMFRCEENTGSSTDPYNCAITDINTANLYWFAINGAAGYELKWAIQNYVANGEDAWIEAELGINGKSLAGHVIITDPTQIYYRIQHLSYQNDYRFAIRALHSIPPSGKVNDPNTAWKMDPKNSYWYGYGDGRHWTEYYGMQTGARYSVPQVLQVKYFDKDSDHYTEGFRVYLNRSIDNGYTEAQMAEFAQHGFTNDGENFRVDYLTIAANLSSPDAYVPEQYKKLVIDWAKLPTEDVKGKQVPYIDIVGLTSNSVYNIDVWNEELYKELEAEGGAPQIDACFNTLIKRVKGVAGPAKLLTWVPQLEDSIGTTKYDISKYNSCKIDHVLNDYYENNEYAENQVFYLEGGKAYHITDNPNLYKGFTLETNPADIAAGKGKAILYLSGMIMDGANPKTANFMLGRQPKAGENSAIPLDIDTIRFKNLDVQVPLARNFGHQNEGVGTATGNYFMNMYSNGMGINVSLLEWDGCDFQGLIRGFFRVQGSNDFNIHELNLKNCTFRNCGFYANGGNGYGYIYADMGSKTASNILEKVEICENIFYETPNSPLITDANRNNNWDADIKWEFDIHHNTFVNWNTQADASQSLINTRYVPSGSKLGFHDNLIIVTAKDGDGRYHSQGGWDVRNIQGGTPDEDGRFNCTFNIGNNWTTADEFSWKNPGEFNGTSNAPGKKAWAEQGCLYPYTIEELKVHVDETLKATDLMENPNPKYMMDASNAKHTDHMTESIDGLYFKQTPEVLNSDLYKSGAGCARLRMGKK